MLARLTVGLVLVAFTPLLPAQVIIDNDAGAPAYVETGAWATSGSTGYNGGTYRFANVGTAATATWTGSLAAAGQYEVFVWYVPGSNRATAAKYDVHAADGTQTVYINQTGGGYTWESLGTFTFNAGDNSVTLDAAGSSGGDVVIADAVRLGDGGGGPIDPPVPVEVAPGVWHAQWNLPTPQVNHVLEFDLADPNYTIEMGFAHGRRNYPSKEGTSQIAARYHSAQHQVVAAVNCAFFEAGLGIHGFLGTHSNLIQPRTDTGWVQQTYGLQESGEGWAASDIAAPTSAARFADNAEMAIGVLDLPCTSNTLALYTPDWGPSTASTSQGVEVIVEGVNYPLRPNKWAEGVITAVCTGSQSVNNPIPINGFVLAACPGAEAELLAHAQVGDPLRVRFQFQQGHLNNAQTLCTGNAWMVKDGLPYHGGGPERHPRTVLAWSGTRHWLITFDGRQPGYSVGVSVAEMQDFLINALHVDNAINLDGGGSTTMVIDGTVVNCPSDGATTPCTGTERAVPNALLLVRDVRHSTLPMRDPFDATGRALAWDDKFTPNPILAIPLPPPGSFDHVLDLKNEAGGYETASIGLRRDASYRVEADVFCEYRPDVAADGFERVGIFARDDGNANFDSPGLGGGNCYALTYDTDDGRIRAAVVVDGVVSDFLAATPLYAPSTAWRQFRIDCRGDQIDYFVGGTCIASVNDTTRAAGRCGLGHHEYFGNDANIHGGRFDDFAMLGMFTGDYNGDGLINMTDFNVLAFCFQGPDFTFPPGHFCFWADADFDSDVDLADFAEFARLFTGP